MPFGDLRSYIQRLEEVGQLQRIEQEVDWNLEIGGIIRRVYDLKAPAPFFQKIKDYPPGYRLLGAPIATSNRPNQYWARLAISMGMDPHSSIVEIMERYIQGRNHPIKPILVSNGPCQENVHIGDEVDLEEFPVPIIHEGDGGRYIGTWHMVATRDPDTGWVNWGMYRLMLHDKKTMGIYLVPYQHIGFHYYQKYEPRNKPMEFAAAIGVEPVTPLIAANRINAGVDEADVIGGIRGEPLELVRCQTVDLAVPATAEIVLEGEIRPHERQYEGPFGEYPGYRVSDRTLRPVCHVKAITHRHDPILTTTNPGVPVTDDTVLRTLHAAALLDGLRNRGLPVEMAYIYPEISVAFTVVSTKVPFTNYAKHLAQAVWGDPAGIQANFLVIVEDDVDATNLNEVMWALTTRCHPDRGIFKMPTAGGPLMSHLSPYEREHHIGASVLFDCTWPKEWPKEAVPVKASFDVLWPKEIQERVLKNWKEYGFGEQTKRGDYGS